MATGVRSKYNLAINSKGFMLRGAPDSPVYQKERSPSLVSQLGVGDLNYNSLNGAGWSYWSQTDWAGGFQVPKFKDDGSFKNGQAVDVLKKYGEVSLQYGWTSAFAVSGSYLNLGSHNVNNGNLIIGVSQAQVSGKAKVLKITSAHTISTLSAMAGVYAVNSMDRFMSNTVVGMSRTSGVSANTMAIYNGSVLSGFRKANPIVRALHANGIRLYSAEKVTSLSGDVLYYATSLSAFTSAYQAGKNRTITKIEDINGTPYFFVVDGRAVDMFTWDETAEQAYPIYSWDDLTSFGVRQHLSNLIITGKSNNKSVAYAFNGARMTEIFDDQLRDSAYDFTNPFEFEGNLQTKSASYDGVVWVPGMYGLLNATHRYTPFTNFANKAYGYVVSGGNAKTYFGYRDTSKYNISGYVISSEFGANIGGVDKLVSSVDINMDALATGQSIEILRSTDGGDTFSSIGIASYAQDGAVKKKTMYFPSGFVTKLWNYKAQIVGPGTSTPILKDVTFQYRPMPDLRKRWHVSIDAGDNIFLLNKQQEQRDGKAIMQDLWLEMEAKRTVTFEDVDAFEVNIVSAMSSAATSARVDSTRLMAPRGRMRAVKNNVVEEMQYTSADGGIVKGITRAHKNTIAQSYTSAHTLNNFYNVIVTDVTEITNDTDEKKTESVARVVILEV